MNNGGRLESVNRLCSLSQFLLACSRMTDDSKFTLRLGIGEARLASGKIESDVFNEGGFRWTVAVERRYVPEGYYFTADAILRCDMNHTGPWNCEAETTIYLVLPSGDRIYLVSEDCCVLNDRQKTWVFMKIFRWFLLVSQNTNDFLEFDIRIISADRGRSLTESNKFSAPNRMSNVILKIGEERLHVSKELLAVHSPVFETMFFGEFAEKGKEEVELKDVVYEEFLDLLNLIYAGTMKITDHNVLHLLKLADQFQVESALEQAKMYFTQSKGFNAMKKLAFADQYRLADIRDLALKSFTSVNELARNMQSSVEYPDFSVDTKVAISDRMVKLRVE